MGGTLPAGLWVPRRHIPDQEPLRAFYYDHPEKPSRVPGGAHFLGAATWSPVLCCFIVHISCSSSSVSCASDFPYWIVLWLMSVLPVVSPEVTTSHCEGSVFRSLCQQLSLPASSPACRWVFVFVFSSGRPLVERLLVDCEPWLKFLIKSFFTGELCGLLLGPVNCS